MADFSRGTIEAGVAVITDVLGGDEMMDIYDEAFAESTTLEERESISEDEAYSSRMNTFFARVLLRAAEQQVILAARMVDDTPSAVPVGS